MLHQWQVFNDHTHGLQRYVWSCVQYLFILMQWWLTCIHAHSLHVIFYTLHKHIYNMRKSWSRCTPLLCLIPLTLHYFGFCNIKREDKIYACTSQQYRLTTYAGYVCTCTVYMAMHIHIVTMQQTVRPYCGSQSTCNSRSCTFLSPCWDLLISVLDHPKQ